MGSRMKPEGGGLSVGPDASPFPQAAAAGKSSGESLGGGEEDLIQKR
jgi:hypothetical protein